MQIYEILKVIQNGEKFFRKLLKYATYILKNYIFNTNYSYPGLIKAYIL